MARISSWSLLHSILLSTLKKPLSPNLWRCLVDLGISCKKPTLRGCRGGQRKQRLAQLLGLALMARSSPQISNLSLLENKNDQPTNVEDQDSRSLHNALPRALNMQAPTVTDLHADSDLRNSSFSTPINTSFSPNNSAIVLHNSPGTNPVPADSRDYSRDSSLQRPTANDSSSSKATTKERQFFVPSVLLSNVISLAPKIDEIAYTISSTKPDVAFFTETWLNGSIPEIRPLFSAEAGC